ncbi:conserved hypothetical protein [Anaeromyxobacter dehalogenans 2CP-1]|uniref:Uncharacterized protein n=1 Tax=Anaeromyxobacter dehalogenans (strain ATCC BAA-258 / DSM 21875 / 2CP-1) TaxID=455488 RepID=B8J7F9_ANAD2|nr:conserved hypothetical protein [Anaeromyxobacter dehalogenans 2CP-1]
MATQYGALSYSSRTQSPARVITRAMVEARRVLVGALATAAVVAFMSAVGWVALLALTVTVPFATIVIALAVGIRHLRQDRRALA